jgi:hypothetical protein
VSSSLALAYHEDKFDFEWHLEGLARVLRDTRDTEIEGAWRTVWDVYEGLCWLRAQVERDLIIRQPDSDLAIINDQIMLYRKWASHVGITRPTN